MEIGIRFVIATLLALLPVQAMAAARPHAATVVVRFDAKRVTSVVTEGLADPATARAVTADDPVRIASISKLVTAIGVVKLVETGKLDLDRDVSDYLGWRLRNPAFPDVPITLSMLLSHQSSLTDDADYLIPLGKTVQDHVADPKAWDAAHPPGGYFRYTNLNFPVIATVMERVTGERFDRLMHALVFAPSGVDACYNWTMCSDAAINRAVVLTDPMGKVVRDDLKGVRPACPVVADAPCDLSTYVIGTNGALFSPQGGLRISMTGLAKIGQMLIRDAKLRALATPRWRFDGTNGVTEKGFFCRYGLATQTLATRTKGCADDPFGDRRVHYGHAGDAYRLKSGLWIDPKTGKGVAYFTTAVAEDAPAGRSAFTVQEETVIRHGRR